MKYLPQEIHRDVGSVPRCGSCQSERVVRDAWACWNPSTGMWEIEAVFDHARCHACDGETKLQWGSQEAPMQQRVRELNDRFRCSGEGRGSVMLTHGVQEKGQAFVAKALQAVQTFSDFTKDNDPWEEHDFGAMTVNDEKVFFKVDYYSPDLKTGSDNPANEAKTHRVLTIMLASEY